MYNKKGAMFGLDARIALAIFGALSVISGAALYSAIQDAKATALITDMNEIGKAWEQYLLDTGQDLPEVTANIRSLTSLTTDPAVMGWRGPYLNYENGTVSGRLAHPNHGDIMMMATQNVDWGEGGSLWNANVCGIDDSLCRNWIMFLGVKDKSLVNRMDQKIDGSDSPKTGKLRWYYINDAQHHRVSLEYAPYQKP